MSLGTWFLENKGKKTSYLYAQPRVSWVHVKYLAMEKVDQETGVL